MQSNRSDVLTKVAMNRTDQVHASEILVEKMGKAASFFLIISICYKPTLKGLGSYTYTLDNGNAAVQALNYGDTLTDTFTYTVSDGNGGTDTATLTITVQGRDDISFDIGSTATVSEAGPATATFTSRWAEPSPQATRPVSTSRVAAQQPMARTTTRRLPRHSPTRLPAPRV